MPTLGDSPEAEAVLRDIKPNEVSAVDVPAIGEPMMVVKGMSNRLDKNNDKQELKQSDEPSYDPSSQSDSIAKQGGQMPTAKLDENQVPRSVMKVVNKRMKLALENIGALQDVAKNLNVADDGSETPPQYLVDMTKSLIGEIRSLQSDEPGKVTKSVRACAESVLSLSEITKRAEDIEKSNAVSYLVRDRWVDVTQSITEYITTYVDGIEHDDAGPMLIPDGLDSTVDKSATEFEELIAEYEDESNDIEEESEESVSDSEGTEEFNIEKAFDMLIGEVKKLGEQMSPSDGSQEDQMETETTEGTEVSTEDQATASEEETSETEETQEIEETSSDEDESESTEGESIEETTTKGTDAILNAIAGMEKKFENRFVDMEKKFEKKLDEVRGVANASAEKVDKALRKRADSRGGAPDSTTKVTEKNKTKNEGSFADVLGLPSSD